MHLYVPSLKQLDYGGAIPLRNSTWGIRVNRLGEQCQNCLIPVVKCRMTAIFLDSHKNECRLVSVSSFMQLAKCGSISLIIYLLYILYI